MNKRKSLWVVLLALLLLVTSCITPVTAASIKDTTYYVQFNSNGGSAVSNIYDVRYGTTIELPDNPTKTGYWFRGWYTDQTLTTKFDPSTLIYRNTTLYAKWEKQSSTPNIMSQTITDGKYSTTITVDINGQNYGNACEMDLMPYERSILQTVVYTQNKTAKYIGFEFNITDLAFDENKPIPVKIKIPSGFSTDCTKVVYTTNRKSVSGIPEGYVNTNNEYVFDAYYSGTYILMECLDTLTTAKDPSAYLAILCDSTKLQKDTQMSMNYQLMNYSGDETQFDFEWYSSKPYIASISKDGVLTAKRAGKTVISCITSDKLFIATKTITVTGTLVTKISTNVSTKKLKKGKTFNIKATISPKNASIKTLRYTSSNPKVATVNNNGKITGKKKGTCYIKVAATDGSGKYKRIKVTVY